MRFRPGKVTNVELKKGLRVLVESEGSSIQSNRNPVKEDMGGGERRGSEMGNGQAMEQDGDWEVVRPQNSPSDGDGEWHDAPPERPSAEREARCRLSLLARALEGEISVSFRKDRQPTQYSGFGALRMLHKPISIALVFFTMACVLAAVCGPGFLLHQTAELTDEVPETAFEVRLISPFLTA